MKKNKNTLLILLLASFMVHGYISKQVDFIKKQANSGIVHASRTDLRGANLKGLQAPGGIFVGAIFQPCVQNSSNSTLGCVPNQKTDLSGADLTGADLSSVNAESVNFTNAILNDAFLFNSNFTQANFTGASWKNVVVVDLSIILKSNSSSTEDNGSGSSATTDELKTIAAMTYDDLKNLDATTYNENVSSYQVTTFCNATMPDGVICSGDSWTDSSGKIFKCNCKAESSADATTETTK